jgi:ankyrin repeat protein
MVKLLLENGANDNNGFSLKWASKNNHYNIVKLLLENGANEARTKGLCSFQ